MNPQSEAAKKTLTFTFWIGIALALAAGSPAAGSIWGGAPSPAGQASNGKSWANNTLNAAAQVFKEPRIGRAAE